MTNKSLRQLLKSYTCVTVHEYTQALKEIIQKLALLGLWRAKFYEHAAFYGGTALRILYGLNRFSEDLDFSLLEPSDEFSWHRYSSAICQELEAFGIRASIHPKIKTRRSAIESAFVKANTREHMLETEISLGERKRIHLEQQIKVRIEIDTDPPPKFSTEEHYLFDPVAFAVRVFSPPDLFAGKLHAILCRTWKKRVKGRDWWDLVWFVGRKTPVNLEHLEVRMRQSGHLDQPLTLDDLRQLLREKAATLDFEKALVDIRPFIADPSSLDLWSVEFFHAVIQKIHV